MVTRGPLPLTAAVATLVVENVLANEVLPEPVYVPANLAAAGVLAGLARRDGLTPTALGLGPHSARRGTRVGAALSVVVAGGLVAGLAIPWARPWLEDERVAGLSAAGLAYQAAVRVPLGTVVLEEFAFRGVLPAMFERRMPARSATVTSQALFGLWHVLPTLSALEANAVAGGTWARSGVVVGAVFATAGAGGFLLWLRRRTGSLLAPAVVHAAANSMGTVAAWFALGRAGDGV